MIRHYRGAEAKPESLAVETQSYARVTRTNVLDGIDLVYYGNQRRLEYDFVVAPGKDPRAIRVQFDGARNVEVEAETGDLLLHVDGGDPVRQHKPVTYQVIDGTRREVESRYVIDANAQVGFEVGAYDAAQPLVIDPVLTYSTYFGNGSEELITDIALDAAGNIYLTGITTDSAQFPVVNAQWPNKPGNIDGFVTEVQSGGFGDHLFDVPRRRGERQSAPSTTAGSRSMRRATPTSPAARSPRTSRRPPTRTTRRSTATRRPATATPTSRS